MPSTRRPSTSTVPRLGGISPDTMLSRVDLPQPDGPTMVTIDPSGTSNVTSRQATTGSRSRGRNTMPTSASRIFAGGAMVAASGTGERWFPAQQSRFELAHDRAEYGCDDRERDQAGKDAGGVEGRGARLDHVAETLVGGQNLRDDHAEQ